jgi:protein arginine N-methyltransferase 1
MYSLKGYEDMTEDSVRMNAHVAALRAVISPSSVVIDLGAGTGVMSLLACRLGAKRVYAIELDDAVAIGRQDAAAHGMSDRITFLQGLSTKVEVPEKADVVVADLRGVLPLHHQSVESLIHARKHFVAPGGTLIPQRDRLIAAIVTAPRSARGAKAWNRSDYGLKPSLAASYLANTPRNQRQSREDLLTAPVCWATLDYSTIESCDVENAVELAVTRAGTAVGISMWFETDLLGEIGYSSGPCDEWTVYGMRFFPLTHPVDVEKNDSVHLAVSARYRGGEYLWQWNTSIRSSRSGERVASFEQSSFHGEPLNIDRLRKSADTFSPTLTEEGRVTRFVLGLMDGTRSNASMAASVAREFPGRFSDDQAALDFVGAICQQYC